MFKKLSSFHSPWRLQVITTGAERCKVLRIDECESGAPLNLVYQGIFSLQLIDHFEIGHIALVQPVYQALLE